MFTNQLKRWLIAVCVAGLVAISSWLSTSTQGSPPVAQEKGLLKPTKMYYGVLACSNGGCHDNPTNPNQKDIILCGYDEVRVWSTQDKHKDANKVLKGERGKQMAKLLSIQGDIAKEPSCVSCHGVLVEDPKLIHKQSFNLEEGVSCGACHGMNKEWVARHSDFLERDNWRALSRKLKEEQFGMRDLWDPEKRATVCVSCHIGNTAEGKVVTHAMYAAGHPPLPGIELATFSDAMPRHWKYLSEKSANVQKILEYDAAKGDLERTQLVVIAGLVSLRESMNLLATQAAQGADAKDPDKSWPELAQFDCYACHHDLKAKSWRQKRGYAGPPGRPDIRPWPTILVHLGVLQAGKGNPEIEKKLTKEMHDKIKELTAAFTAQPFGDPKLVAQAARQTSQWADGLLQEIKPTRFDRVAAHNLLLGLGKESKSRLLDFDSARQLTWAFRSIQHEWDPKSSVNAENAKLLKELDEQLKLDLPNGQVEIAKDYLKDALEKLNNFEPSQFNQTFEKLIQQVQKEPK
jgi:hypothetical protein